MTTFGVGRAPVEIYLGVTYTIGVTYFSQRFSSNFKRAVLRAQVELGDAPQLVSRASYAYEHVGRAYRGRSARYGCVPWPSVSAIVGAYGKLLRKKCIGIENPRGDLRKPAQPNCIGDS